MGDTAFGKSGMNAGIGTIRDVVMGHSIQADQAQMIETNALNEGAKRNESIGSQSK